MPRKRIRPFLEVNCWSEGGYLGKIEGYASGFVTPVNTFDSYTGRHGEGVDGSRGKFSNEKENLEKEEMLERDKRLKNCIDGYKRLYPKPLVRSNIVISAANLYRSLLNHLL